MLFLALACHPTDSDTVPDVIWGDPVTTLTHTVIANTPLGTPTDLDPALPDGDAAAEGQGLGGWTEGPGEPRILRDDLAPGHGGGGARRRSLWMFLQQTDAQLADVESPTRMVATDAVGPTQSAARPQEIYEAQALDALIRTANGLSEAAPIDFAVCTGDNADSVQENELRWFAAIWDGTPVSVDSGLPDSQPDEDGNDPIAEFTPVGADFPWYGVAGNHDVLVQGNFPPDTWTDNALGTDAPLGTRDLSLPGGPLTFTTEADPRRKLMDRSDIASVYLDSPATPGPVGHGFTTDNVTGDTVTWMAHPVEGVPIRLVSVDANPHGSADGELSAKERDEWLIPQLDDAQAAGDLVVLTSHYALGTVPIEGGGTVGDLLLGYPNVILVVAGHWHENLIRKYGTPGDAGGFWEIVSASTADWPAQGRLVELVDNGDQTLSILTTMFDVPAPEGSMAARFRQLLLVDWQSGWRLSDGSGAPEDRNTELVETLPFPTTGGRDGVRSASLP
jgi:hypothetical protein